MSDRTYFKRLDYTKTDIPSKPFCNLTCKANGQAEAEKQQRHHPHQLFVFKAVEGVAFGNHHIQLPKSGKADTKHTGRQENQAEVLMGHGVGSF